MPTGYTATLVEKGQTFEQFVMTCARAFGALIDMRDESLDAPIPEKFEPSSYHAERLEEARQKLDRLRAMTDAEREAFGKAERAQAIKNNRAYLAKVAKQNERVDEMIKEVEGWNPPSFEHVELKNFMLDQLRISRGSTEYTERDLKRHESRPAADYYTAAIADAERDITYHTENLQKDRQRADSRNEWVRKLRESLVPGEVESLHV